PSRRYCTASTTPRPSSASPSSTSRRRARSPTRSRARMEAAARRLFAPPAAQRWRRTTASAASADGNCDGYGNGPGLIVSPGPLRSESPEQKTGADEQDGQNAHPQPARQAAKQEDDPHQHQPQT